MSQITFFGGAGGLVTPVSVPNGGTGIAAITDHALIVGSGVADVTVLAAATDGQIPIGSTGADPTIGNITSTGGTLTITNGAGAINMEAVNTGSMDGLDGDTGSAVPTLGIIDVVGGNNITTAAALSAVTVSVSGTTQYAIQLGNATASLTSLALGSANQVLHSNGAGANPSWSAVDLAADVTGTLPVANGGTGTTTLTDHGLMLGSGAGAVTILAEATDGQIPIGSTGNDPVLATITAGTGVTITNAAGAITVNAPGVDQTNIIYIGKHGNDANDGLTIEKAFLTIGAAITAASSGDTVWCFDDGTYTENLTGAAGVSIYAPNATLAGAHTITQNNTWTFAELTVATGVTGVTLNSAGNTAYLYANKMTITGTGVGILNLAGKIFANIGFITLVNGFFLGSTTADETYIKFHEIAVSGTGIVFVALVGAVVQVSGNCVENSGAGNCTVFFTNGAGVPEINATISHVDTDILSDITAGSMVHLNVGYLNGTLAESGAGTVIVGGATRIDEVPIGAVTPSTGAFTTLSATTPIPVTSGGVGVATLTDHGVLVGSGAGAVTPLAAATNGQLIIGSTGADPAVASLTAGANIVITPGAGSISIASTASGGISWSIITADLNPMVVDTGYICNKAGLLTVTLPTTAAVGTVQRVTGINTDLGWKIAQSANQIIHFGDTDTTTGAGGSLASVLKRDSVEMVCVVADLEWNVISSIGNITIV